METNLLINADRIRNEEQRLYFCQDYEDVAFSIADMIKLDGEDTQFDDLKSAAETLDLSMFEDFDFYADIATVEDAEGAEWGSVISKMIMENGDHLGDYDVGIVGIKRLDDKNMGFVSFYGKLSDELLAQCKANM